MIRRPPRSTQSRSSAASDVYKRQEPWVTDHVGIPEQLPDHDPAVVSHNSVQLGQRLVLHGNLPEHRDEKGPVEVVVRIRQYASVAEPRGDVREPCLLSAAHGVIEHPGLYVERLENPVRTKLPGNVDRVMAGSRTDF